MTTDRIAKLETLLNTLEGQVKTANGHLIDANEKMLAIRHDLRALKAQPAEKWPQPGNEVYALYASGVIHPQVWKDGSDDRYLLAAGLIHRTEADANAAHARRVLDTKLRRLGNCNTGEYVIRWDRIRGAWYAARDVEHGPLDVKWSTANSTNAAIGACITELHLAP